MRAAAALGRRQVLVLGAAATAATLALSGCAAGQQAQTAEQTSVVDGTGFQVGEIAVRDLGVQAPSAQRYRKGDTAYLQGIITNTGVTSDQLVSVSSPIANGAAFFPDATTAQTALAGSSSSSSASASSSASSSAGASASASPSGSAGVSTSGASQQPTAGEPQSSPAGSSTPTGSSSAPAAGGGALQSVPTEAGQAVRIGYEDTQVQIALLDLKSDIAPAQTLTVTMVFAKAGPVTAIIAVKLAQDQTQSAPSIDTGREGE